MIKVTITITVIKIKDITMSIKKTIEWISFLEDPNGYRWFWLKMVIGDIHK